MRDVFAHVWYGGAANEPFTTAGSTSGSTAGRDEDAMTHCGHPVRRVHLLERRVASFLDTRTADNSGNTRTALPERVLAACARCRGDGGGAEVGRR